MAQERIGMRKIKEVLRLKYEHDLSVREIAQSCGISRRTAGKYIEAAQLVGIKWGDDKSKDDVELMERLFGNGPAQEKVLKKSKAQPNWLEIHQELKKPHVTLNLLWQEYRASNPDGYQHSQFGELYRRWRGKLNVCMRQEHRAGEKLFVDYCDGINIVDRSTGETTPTQLFIGVWGASSYTYVEASMSQKKRDWIMSHVRAFEYYQCVPHIIIPDNLRSGVTRVCRYEPEINATYQDLAEHYGTCVIPARPYRPRDKAKVEAGVLVAQRWILACLRNSIFYSLAELNEAIWKLLEKLNTRQMQKLKTSRRVLFESLDKPAALALVSKRYEYAQWKKARVNIDYHVEIDGHYYSVPYQLIHNEVDVRLSDKVIEIFYKGKRQASHCRNFEKHKHTTKPEHMPETHRKYMEWNPSRILDWANKVGPSTKDVVNNILESKKYPELGYRSCLGILKLTKYYEFTRLENACKRAVLYRTFSFKSIKSILENNLDKDFDISSDTAVANVSPAHENVRGSVYYIKNDSHQLN